ncbi:hypothetical protein [Synechococcus sp. MIT S1220]|uniref:hypothetical protein n=1 Tax=Synechococcus sp. MIT S1220 TaxID=3082549 RepID=UPI0039B05F3F
MERWAWFDFRFWDELPSFTGRPAGAKQRAAWWCEIPRETSGDSQVKLRFRSMTPGIDYRLAHGRFTKAEEAATAYWVLWNRDPIVELGRLQ